MKPTFTFQHPLLPHTLYVFVCDQAEANANGIEAGNNTMGMAESKKNQHYVWLRKGGEELPLTIVHEMIHIILNICDQENIDPIEAQEVIAYSVEWFTRNILKALAKPSPKSKTRRRGK